MSNVKNKTKGYNIISRDVVFDTTISDRARFLYVYMACKPAEWDFYQDKVAEELGYKKDTLRKYLDELITRGWITEEEQRNAGQFNCLCYTIEIVRRDGNLPIRKNTVTEKNRIGKNHNQRDIDNNSSTKNSPTIRDIDKKSISNDIPKKEQRHKNFVKPTIEEIEAYIKSMGYKSSAEEFFNYHEAGGWVIGRNRPMIDWRAAVRTWESKERKKRPTAYDVNPEDKIKEIKFKSYMREKYPDIETAHKPLSFDGYMELIHDYGVDYVTDKLDHIVTYFGKYKGCDIYKLIKSWLSEDGRD